MSLHERVNDHLIPQYIWAMENDAAFLAKSKHELERQNYERFVNMRVDACRSIRQTLDDKLDYFDSAFLNVEMWIRCGGTLLSNDKFQANLNTLREEGYGVNAKGVVPLITKSTIPEPKKEEPIMSNKIEFTTITYINNVDVTKLTDDQLIDAIKTIEGEIADLKAVKTKSLKITAKITQATDTLAKVVEVLDSRA